MKKSSEYRLRKMLPKLIVFSVAAVSVLVLAYLLLFSVNRFSLVLTPRGAAEVTHAYGESWNDPGVEAKLTGTLFFTEGIAVDAAITVRGDGELSLPGEYQLDYQGKFCIWEASCTRTVRIVDISSPRITLISAPESVTVIGESYTEEGYCAWDDCDGDLTALVIRKEAEGVVTYRVSDSAGNTTCISRKIRYIDPVAPEIQLLGDNPMYLDAGENYQEPGWSATDNVDGDITGKVQTIGSVDPFLSGTYEITYRVSDQSGNVTTVCRTVIVQPRAQAETVSPEGKVVYLTFDDGPGMYTQQLLDILDKYNVKATFFVVKTDYTYLIREIYQRGHAVGIHSVTHNYARIYSGADAFFSDLLAMQHIIEEQTGEKTWLMRFPGGSSNTVSRFNPGIMTYLTQAVEDMGFCYFDWNVDSNDAGGARTALEVFENVKKGLENGNVSIVLQHDIKGFSVEAVDMILSWGIANGYTFLPLDMTSPTAHHGVNN